MLHPQSAFGSDGSTLTLDRSDTAAAESPDSDQHRQRPNAAASRTSEAGCALVLLDERSQLAKAVVEVLERRGYATRTTSSAEEARRALHRLTPDLAVLDGTCAESHEQALGELLRQQPDMQVIVIDADTAHADGSGNGDAYVQHLARPVDLDELDRLLQGDSVNGKAAAGSNGHTSNGHTSNGTNGSTRAGGNGHVAPRRRSAAALPERASSVGCGLLVGESQPMRQIYKMIEKVAPTDATVFVAGESGTGKELVAQAVHQHSARAGRPFVAVNCGAIPDGLIDSELFGHEKGAFTGATRARGGVFEQAQGGTLFLDEITEMPIDLQARLLRVLETGRVHRVGSERDVPVDVRVITASNRPAAAALEQGRLREDLLYRLSVFPIQLPPLRDRGEDTVLLASHFLAELNEQYGEQRRFSNGALELIRTYHWPGNVRQLMHAVHRASILADGVIEADLLPAQVNRPPVEANGAVQLAVGTSVAEAERRLIETTLEHFSGDKKKAADVLGMSLRTLYNRLNIYKAQQSNGGRKSKRKGREHAPQDEGKDFLFTE